MSGMTVVRGIAGLGLMMGVSGMVSGATKGVMDGDGPSVSTFNAALTGGSLLALTLLTPNGAQLGASLLRNAGIGAAIGLGTGLLLGAFSHKDAATGAGELQPPTPGVDAGSTSGGGDTDFPVDGGPSDAPPATDTYPDGNPVDGGTIDGGTDFPVDGGPSEAPPTPDTLPDGGDGHVPVDPPPVDGHPWNPGSDFPVDGGPGEAPPDAPYLPDGSSPDDGGTVYYPGGDPTGPPTWPPSWGGDPGFYVDPPSGWNGDPGFSIDPPSNWNGDPGFYVDTPTLQDRFAAAGARPHPGSTNNA